jgi:hypothetical protein
LIIQYYHREYAGKSPNLIDRASDLKDPTTDETQGIKSLAHLFLVIRMKGKTIEVDLIHEMRGSKRRSPSRSLQLILII